MPSAISRRGADGESFVAGELKAIFYPCGGAWQYGVYPPNVPALIGEAIKEQFEQVGCAKPAASVS